MNMTWLDLFIMIKFAIDTDPPIQQVIDTGIVPLLKDLLLEDKEPHLQVTNPKRIT